MMRKYFLLAAFFNLLLPWVKAQDLAYARSCMKTLCSEEFAGRGYVDEGDLKAARFIRDEFSKHKLLPLGENYFQPLGFPVIYYPERADMELDGKIVYAGYDFVLNPGCPSLNGTFKIMYLDSETVDNSSTFERIRKKNLKGYFLVVDELKGKKLIHTDRVKLVLTNGLKAKGLIYRNQEHLLWSPSMEFASFPVIYFKQGEFPALVLKMHIQVDAKHTVHATQNVLGMIKGKVKPDSFIVVTAHYDHLGMLGRSAIFPGGNDNASGVSMMLDLARYFSQNPPAYSVLFIAFAGEEIGLVGSLYYTENPVIPLKQMSLLINLDLMATGDEGMTVVNATEFPALFEGLKLCNSIGNYLPDIAPRGKAANSDHYYFTEKGVPALYFYLRGNYHHYHDVDDTYEALTLSRYEGAFQLIRDFIRMRMDQ